MVVQCMEAMGKEEETKEQLILRFNKEKTRWQEGLVIWLICFMALQILGMIWDRIQVTNIIINGIILLIVSLMYRKSKKKVEDGKKD